MILYGAGGHAKVIIETLEYCKVEIEAVYDDNPNIQSILGYQVRSVFDFKHDQESEFIVSIGCNRIREKVALKLAKQSFGRVVDPSARIARSTMIGHGTVVMPGSVVNSSTVIGRHCIINTSAVVEHDCNLGDFVHVAPNAVLCGNVRLGKGTFIGAGAVLIPGVTIGSKVTVGAGSVVLNDLPDGCTVVGSPAEII